MSRFCFAIAFLLAVGTVESASADWITLQVDSSRSHITLSNPAGGWTPLVEGGLTAPLAGSFPAWLVEDSQDLIIGDIYGGLEYDAVYPVEREVSGYAEPAAFFVSTGGGFEGGLHLYLPLFNEEYPHFFSILTSNSSRSVPMGIDGLLYGNGFGTYPSNASFDAHVDYSLSGNNVELTISFEIPSNPLSYNDYGLNAEIVATATIPEPSTLTMCILAGPILLVAARRGTRRHRPHPALPHNRD